jgi:hypothetical protein
MARPFPRHGLNALTLWHERLVVMAGLDQAIGISTMT